MFTRTRAGLTCAMLSLVAGAAFGAPPEVSGVAVSAGEGTVTASWSALDQALAYHVYEGDVAGLPSGDYGACESGSNIGTSSKVPVLPAPGRAFFLVVSAFDETGEGSLGQSSSGAERHPPSPCTPARRVFRATPNGVALDGVEDGPSWRGPRQSVSLDGSYSHRAVRSRVSMGTLDGDVIVAATDLAISGRGFDWTLARTYHSQLRYDGPMGSGWDFADNLHLQPLGGDIVIHDGAGQRLTFRRRPGSSSFTSPPGFYGRLIRNPDGTFSLRFEAGDPDRPLVVTRNRRPGRPVYGNITLERARSFASIDNAPEEKERGLRGTPGDGVLGRSKYAHVYQHNQSDLDFLRMHGGTGGGGGGGAGGFAAASINTSHAHVYQHNQSDLDFLRTHGGTGGGGGGGAGGFAAVSIDTSRLNIENVGTGLTLNLSDFPRPGPGLLGRFAVWPHMHQKGTHGRRWNTDPYAEDALRWSTDPYAEDALRWNTDPYAEDALRWNTDPYAEDALRWNTDPYAEDALRMALYRRNPHEAARLSSRVVIADFDRDGRLDRIADSAGHTQTYVYDKQKLLTQVVDTLGRTIRYEYDAAGRVRTVTDPTGREVAFTYNAAGNLVSVRSPPVTGTPTGNDYPAGKTTTYTYQSGVADPKLDGNLLTITPPGTGGSPALQFEYGPPATFAADRLVAVTLGGTNASGVPAGGTATFDWWFVNPGADPGLGDVTRRILFVSDTANNVVEYDSNAAGQVLAIVEETNREVRPGEPDYTTQMRYNADGEVVSVDRPDGSRALYTYDATGADRFRQGNLLEARFVADPARGNGHGSPAADRVWRFTYEPVDNQLASVTDPRGNDPAYVPPNGGAWSPERYTTRITYDYQEGEFATNGIEALAARWGISLAGAVCCLGDVDGDGRTDRAIKVPGRIEWPDVVLDAGSRQAAIEGDTSQDVVALFSHDDAGQLTRVRDPEGNVHAFTWDRGLLASARFDTEGSPERNSHTNPVPVDVRFDYSYDALGRLVRVVDGRGVLHRAEYNQLDELVQVIDGAATADSGGPFGDPPTGRGEVGLSPPGLRHRFVWDSASDLGEIQVEDPGQTRGVGTFVTTTLTHDILGKLVRVQQPVGGGSAPLTTELRYTANGLPASITHWDGTRGDFVHDERGLLFSATVGAGGPYGGTPATSSCDYSPVGLSSRCVDAEGGITDFDRDGHGELVRAIDEIGSELVVTNDFTNAGGDLYVFRGPPGGPTPPDRSGSTNVDLARVVVRRDELDRPFRFDRALFIPNGTNPLRPPSIGEGTLVPGDGQVNAIVEYDRSSRPTYVIDDDGTMVESRYDGAGRPRYRGQLANVGTNPMYEEERTFDGAGAPVEVVATSHSSQGLAPVIHLTTAYYDALGRPVTVVDPDGRARDFLWNTLADLGAVSDANGPPGRAIRRRSPGHTGEIVESNRAGNVTRYAYDGAGRPVRRDGILTASGQGDGTFSPAPDTSNPDNPDGLNTTRKTWLPANFRLKIADDAGNETRFAFDNLGNLTRRENPDGTASSATFDRRGLPRATTDENGSRIAYTRDAAGRVASRAVSPAAGLGGTTQQQYEYDGLSRLTRTLDDNGQGTDDDVAVDLLYDSLGRLVEETQSRPGAAAVSTDYGWRAAGLLTGVSYPGGRQLEYTYDAYGRVAALADATSGASESRSYLGRHRQGSARSNGIASQVTFDGAWRVTGITHTGPLGDTLAGFQYQYDRDGNLLSEVRLHDGRGRAYEYDSAGRLVAWQDSGAAPYGESYVYDGRSNLLRSTRGGHAFRHTPNNNSEYNEPQGGGSAFDDGTPDDFLEDLGTPALDGLNFAYDRAGNQTVTGPVRVTYDALGRPVTVARLADQKTVGQYAYDGLGRMVRRVDETSQETRVFGSLVLGAALEERGPTGAITLALVPPFGWRIDAGGAVRVRLDDGLGRVVAVCDDGSSGVLERIVYDAGQKPLFLAPDGVPIVDALGRFVAASSSGEGYLLAGARYLPEFGARTGDRATDLGGAHDVGATCWDTNQARVVSLNGLPPGQPYLRGRHESAMNSIRNMK